MKKLLAMLLSVLLALSFVGVWAEDGAEGVQITITETTANAPEAQEVGDQDMPAAEPEEKTSQPEEKAEEPEKETAEHFTGDLFTRLVNEGIIRSGDEVLFRATALKPNMGYVIVWQALDTTYEEAEWEEVSDNALLGFTAAKYYEKFAFRAVLTADDGRVICSELYQIKVYPALETEDEAEQPEEEISADDITVDAIIIEETADEPTETEEPAESAETDEPAETEEPAEPAETDEADEPAEAEETTEADETAETAEPEEATEQDAEPDTYTYERDGEGELVTDDEGNPIVTVEGEAEVPVTYQRDEEGNLVLDENGNPIPVDTVPQDAEKVLTLEDVLDPNRSIDIYASWNNETPAFGGTVTFVAVLSGYDNLTYDLQWQQSEDNSAWVDIDGANELRYTVQVTKANYKDFWRVEVIVTGVAAE